MMPGAVVAPQSAVATFAANDGSAVISATVCTNDFMKSR